MANIKRITKSKNLQIRLRPAEFKQLRELTERLNFLSLSELVRFALRKTLQENKMNVERLPV